MIDALVAVAAGPFFTLGVSAGEIRPGNALLWAHASRAGGVKVEVARDPGFRRIVVGRTARALASADDTVHIRIGRLLPGRHYFYRFVHGNGRSAVGRFHVGSNGAGLLISGLFFKPAPPRGVGMRCVSPDTYSYGEVVVTTRTLTITPKDASGNVVRDVTGQPCQPVVIRAH